jgi:hypothetical protein
MLADVGASGWLVIASTPVEAHARRMVPLEGLENCDRPLSTISMMAKTAEFRAFQPLGDDCDHVGTHSIVGKLWANSGGGRRAVGTSWVLGGTANRPEGERGSEPPIISRPQA